jgi:hypothetical protein
MIAVLRAELMTILRQRRTMSFAFLAIIAPFIIWFGAIVIETIDLSQGAYQLSYPDALLWTAVLGTLTTALCSIMLATASHRHGVFQAFVVTGVPRDYFLVGRILIAMGIGLVVSLSMLCVNLIVHTVSWPDASQLGYDESISVWIGDVGTSNLFGDIGIIVLGIVAAGAIAAALATFVRSAFATIVVIGGWLFLDGTLVSGMHGRWSEDTHFLTLAEAFSEPPAFHLPAWSVTSTLQSAAYRIEGQIPLEGVPLTTVEIATFVIGAVTLASALALYRMARRDV